MSHDLVWTDLLYSHRLAVGRSEERNTLASASTSAPRPRHCALSTGPHPGGRAEPGPRGGTVGRHAPAHQCPRQDDAHGSWLRTRRRTWTGAASWFSLGRAGRVTHSRSLPHCTAELQLQPPGSRTSVGLQAQEHRQRLGCRRGRHGVRSAVGELARGTPTAPRGGKASRGPPRETSRTQNARRLDAPCRRAALSLSRGCSCWQCTRSVHRGAYVLYRDPTVHCSVSGTRNITCPPLCGSRCLKTQVGESAAESAVAAVEAFGMALPRRTHAT